MNISKQSSLCTIFLDSGNGFNKDEYLLLSISKYGNQFRVSINITPNIKGIRFDPYEGYGCIITDFQVLIDGNSACYSYTNSNEINSVLFFDNLDPQIAIDFNSKVISTVILSGEIYRINPANLSILLKYRRKIEKTTWIRKLLKIFKLHIICLQVLIFFKNFGKHFDKTGCVIYIDTGNNFNEKETTSVLLNKIGSRFCAIIQPTSNAKRIRFDPYEGYGCIITNLQIFIDGNPAHYSYTNSNEIDNVLFFDDLDPQVAIDFNQRVISTIVISGNIFQLYPHVISTLSRFKRIYEKYIAKKRYIRKIFKILNLYIACYRIIVFLFKKGRARDSKRIYSFKDVCSDKSVLYHKKLKLSYTQPQFDNDVSKSIIYEDKLYAQYAVKLESAMFFGCSSLIIWKNKVVYDLPFYDMDRRYNYTDPQIIKVKGSKITFWKNQKARIDRAIWMGGCASYNYYHLMYEYVIKFLKLQTLNISTEIPVFVDQICLDVPQYRELLELVNKKKYPLLPAHPDYCYITKELYYINCPNYIPVNFIDDNDIKAEDFQFDVSLLMELRNYLLSYSSKNVFPEKIFISRKNANKIRNYNEDEVKEIFLNDGFEIVYPETLSIKDQIAMFHQVKYIAGGSGAAFTNILFCNDHCKCLVFAKSTVPLSIFSTIAHIAGVDLKYITEEATRGKNKIDSIHESFEIDVNYLKKYLSSWCN
ncbi:MAG: glycosyltransferase family 61 protein [Spirochaetaceae bacterium]|nr:glycosyltransferase family 61 protein [Spirochaetaceae bacterium]